MREIKRINVEFIPHHKQRYDTGGDYYFDPRNPHVIHIRISRHKNPLISWLILIHEIVELAIVLKQKIKFEDIDRFDTNYAGNFPNDPGSDLKAPYHYAHQVALACEEISAKAVEVQWGSY